MMERASGGVEIELLMQRVRRIFTLDASVYDEIRADRAATVPAAIVVVGATLVFALGGWLWWLINGPDGSVLPGSGEVFLKSVLVGTVLASLLWAAWVAITYVMLNQLFHARADVNELARVMGFAAAPLAVGVLMFLPEIDFAVGLTAVTLLFGSTLIAVQSATDAAPGKALAATAAGFLVWALVLCLFVTDSNFYAPGFFIFELGAEVLSS